MLSLAYHEPPAEAAAARLERLAAAGQPLFAGLLQALRDSPPAEARQEFFDLFMVPGPRYAAPYESVYTDSPIVANDRATPRTFGPSTQAVLWLYERIGLEIAQDYTELPDYIGLELACMEYLCIREAEYLEARDEEAAGRARSFQQAFVRDHLGRWIHALAARVEEQARTSFFRELARATSAWIRDETDSMGPKP